MKSKEKTKKPVRKSSSYPNKSCRSVPGRDEETQADLRCTKEMRWQDTVIDRKRRQREGREKYDPWVSESVPDWMNGPFLRQRTGE